MAILYIIPAKSSLIVFNWFTKPTEQSIYWHEAHPADGRDWRMFGSYVDAVLVNYEFVRSINKIIDHRAARTFPHLCVVCGTGF